MLTKVQEIERQFKEREILRSQHDRSELAGITDTTLKRERAYKLRQEKLDRKYKHQSELNKARGEVRQQKKAKKFRQKSAADLKHRTLKVGHKLARAFDIRKKHRYY